MTPPTQSAAAPPTTASLDVGTPPLLQQTPSLLPLLIILLALTQTLIHEEAGKENILDR